MHVASRGVAGILPALVFSGAAFAQAPVLPDTSAPPPQDPNAQTQPQYRYQYTAPQPPPAQPSTNQYQYQAPATPPPANNYQYQAPAQTPPPANNYQYQAPAQPPPTTYQQPAAQPPPSNYQYQQPAPAQPYQQPGAQPAPHRERAANDKDPSLIDDVQAKLIYHSKRATLMSLPALAVLAAGLVVGGVIGAIVAGTFLGYGLSTGILNANLAPVLLLMALPAVPLGAMFVGGIAYAIARVVTVALVSMFYPGDAETMDDRIRNMRVNVVADGIGHVASLVGALSIIGAVTVVSALVSSFIGLAALIVIVQTNAGKSFDQIKFDPYVPLPLLLVALGITGLFMAAGAFVVNILLAHVSLPLSTVVTKATVFGDSDRE